MSNCNMPAMPFEAVMSRTNGVTTGWTNYTGLTKREMMAMHMMQGLISANATYGGRTDARDLTAADAVAYADALLAELELTSGDES